MRFKSNRSLLGSTLVIILMMLGILAYGSTCDRPQVDFKDGLLSAQSTGCSLEQLLQAVQDKTGIQIEVPASAAQIPVVIRVGPDKPAAVIASLLDGMKFNYFLVGGGGNSLARVIVTEQVGAAEVSSNREKAIPPVPAAVRKTAAITQSKKEEGKKKEEKKEDELADNQPAGDADGLEQASKPELDEATLKKLPQLPPGVPSVMWRLYPEIVSNGGIVPGGPPTLPGGVPLAQSASAEPGSPLQLFYPQDLPPLPKGVVGMPTLPPEVDPNMGKLYPWNLMQTINGPITYPNIQLPPMALPIGVAPNPHP
jgi:hypothetical protein